MSKNNANDKQALAASTQNGTCYKVHCHHCQTSNPAICGIAMDARLEEQNGEIFWRNLAAYRIE